MSYYASIDETIRALEGGSGIGVVTFPLQGPRWLDIIGMLRQYAMMHDVRVIDVSEAKGLLRKQVMVKVDGKCPDLVGFLHGVQELVD